MDILNLYFSFPAASSFSIFTSAFVSGFSPQLSATHNAYSALQNVTHCHEGKLTKTGGRKEEQHRVIRKCPVALQISVLFG